MIRDRYREFLDGKSGRDTKRFPKFTKQFGMVETKEIQGDS
jgi:hypothetical protein